MKKKKKQFYIITGYSGSGKTTSLRYIEELGFYCVDNLPAELLQSFMELLNSNHSIEKIAVVIDARGRAFMKTLETDVTKFKQKYDLRVLFLESNLQVITKRYKESRLKHPLSLKGTIKDGYNTERELLNSLRQHSDLIINTSLLNIHALKSVVQKYILRHEYNIFEIHLMTFGFKYGLPFEADIVIDVRFLANPYFVPRLKHKNGHNKEVQNYIFKDKHAALFIQKTKSYLEYLLKRYKAEGKSYVTIAFGCTGGRHRSVAMAEKLVSQLNIGEKNRIQVHHRDIKE